MWDFRYGVAQSVLVVGSVVVGWGSSCHVWGCAGSEMRGYYNIAFLHSLMFLG